MIDRALRVTILMLNSIGFLGFLGWLMVSRERILYTQEGVLYLLPCLPFFFVYVYLFKSGSPDDEE